VRTDQQDWPWPDELDALIAAPENHTLLFENESVRVLDTRIGPGRTTPVHTHCWPGVLYVRRWSDFVRRDENDNIVLDSRKVESLVNPPAVMEIDSLPPHTLENVGENELWVIGVELKSRVS
jgi:hypothetical protein